MPKFNANLTLLFNELDFLDRFKAASDAGFRGVEYLFPYAYHKHDLVERLQLNGLTQVLHNLPAGDWAAGERGIACLPERCGEFQDGVGTAIEYAQALQCTQLNCLAGIAPRGRDPATLHDTLVRNLRFFKAHFAGCKRLRGAKVGVADHAKKRQASTPKTMMRSAEIAKRPSASPSMM